MQTPDAPPGYMALRDSLPIMGCTIHTARLRIRRRLLGAVRVWPLMVFVKTDDVYRLAANPPKRGRNTGVAHRRTGQKETFRPMWNLPVVHPERTKKLAATAPMAEPATTYSAK